MVDERGRERARYVMLRLLERAREKQVGVPALRSTDYINTIPPEREPWFPGDEEIERRIRAPHPLERRGHGVHGQPQGPRGRRPHRDVPVRREPLRGRLQPLLPRQGPPRRRRPDLHPGPRLPRHLRPRLPRGPAHRGAARPVPPGGPARPGAGPVVVPAPAADAGLLGVPDRLDGPDRHQLDLPGPVQPLPPQPRHQGHQPTSTSGRSSATARWASPSRSARSASPRARSSTTSPSSSTATCSSSTARCAATARSSRSWSRSSAAPAGTSSRSSGAASGTPLLARDVDGVLVNRMNTTPDGQFQTYSVESGAYIREHFFGGDPRLRKMVEHLTDERDRAAAARRPRLPQGVRRVRGRHQARRPADGDPRPDDQGLDDRRAGGQERHPPDEEAQRRTTSRSSATGSTCRSPTRTSTSLQHRRLAPFYHPGEDCDVIEYMRERRRALGGSRAEAAGAAAGRSSCPATRCTPSSSRARASRRSPPRWRFVRLLKDLMKDPEIGQRIVPIAPDEYRTFGMDSMFPTAKIYNPARPALRVGRPQAAAVLQGVARRARCCTRASPRPARWRRRPPPGRRTPPTASTMIPFYIFYSMFGFQRTGDSIWAMADQLARGFLIGATAGRTTLTGEGLQHADGHSPLLAAHQPGGRALRPGVRLRGQPHRAGRPRRMYGSTDEHPHGENVIYYLTVYNEPIVQPKPSRTTSTSTACCAASTTSRRRRGLPTTPRGSSCSPPASAARGSPRRQQLLAEDWGVAADTLVGDVVERAGPRRASPPRSGTSSTPARRPRSPYVTDKLTARRGPVVAVQRLHARRAAADRPLGARRLPRPRRRRLRLRRHPPGRPPVLPHRRRVGRRPGPRRRSPTRARSTATRSQKAFDDYRIDDPTAVAASSRRAATPESAPRHGSTWRSISASARISASRRRDLDRAPLTVGHRPAGSRRSRRRRP